MFGWDVPQKRFDWEVLRDNVFAEVDRLEGAYTETLTNHGVEIIHERATITGPHDVRLGDGTEVTADKILIATGARPVNAGLAGHRTWRSPRTRYSISTSCPKRILIAGGGYIANEFAGIFHQFGSHVTLINRTDVILRGYDEQIAIGCSRSR